MSGETKTPYRTGQELFNLAVRGLRGQGWKQSVWVEGTVGSCSYRGTEGRRCAIGWCIPDEVYDENLEGKTVWESSVVRAAAGIRLQDRLLAARLQDTHDLNGGRAMEETFRQLARDYGLEWPE